jgi:DNA-binding NarL/FixJ family response regulator
MARICCLAAIDPDKTQLLSAALKGAGEPSLAVLAGLDVAALNELGPSVLIADLDWILVDQLEMLRQLRFVLPDCLIAVYTELASARWAHDCHLAGANCLLSKASTESELITGLRHAIASGCYTDPRFAA